MTINRDIAHGFHDSRLIRADSRYSKENTIKCKLMVVDVFEANREPKVRNYYHSKYVFSVNIFQNENNLQISGRKYLGFVQICNCEFLIPIWCVIRTRLLILRALLSIWPARERAKWGEAHDDLSLLIPLLFWSPECDTDQYCTVSYLPSIPAGVARSVRPWQHSVQHVPVFSWSFAQQGTATIALEYGNTLQYYRQFCPGICPRLVTDLGSLFRLKIEHTRPEYPCASRVARYDMKKPVELSQADS